MSRNKIFCRLILEFLRDGDRLYARDFYALVEALEPEMCVNDWQKGVQGALRFLVERNRITYETSPESGRKYIYRLAP